MYFDILCKMDAQDVYHAIAADEMSEAEFLLWYLVQKGVVSGVTIQKEIENGKADSGA
jgi:hypothetical protein